MTSLGAQHHVEIAVGQGVVFLEPRDLELRMLSRQCALRLAVRQLRPQRPQLVHLLGHIRLALLQHPALALHLARQG
ncbi:hypothetical protein GGI05_005984, partial [Coemansia sp. RSA 2603]